MIGGLSSLMLGTLERHLDTTFGGWSSILAAGVRLVISRLVLIATLATRVRLVVDRLVLVFALPLDFMGGLGSLGPCSFMVLFMVLRPLHWHLQACVNCGLLFTRLFGLVVSRWLVWVRFSA